MTLGEIRSCIRATLLESVQYEDFSKLMEKIYQRIPFTVDDVSTFVEMCIDHYADDTEFRINDEFIDSGWKFLEELSKPTSGSPNALNALHRLRGLAQKLGKERREANEVTDWDVKERVDSKIDEFMQNRVDDYAERIVKCYHPGIVKWYEQERQDKVARRRDVGKVMPQPQQVMVTRPGM